MEWGRFVVNLGGSLVGNLMYPVQPLSCPFTHPPPGGPFTCQHAGVGVRSVGEEVPGKGRFVVTGQPPSEEVWWATLSLKEKGHLHHVSFHTLVYMVRLYTHRRRGGPAV